MREVERREKVEKAYSIEEEGEINKQTEKWIVRKMERRRERRREKHRLKDKETERLIERREQKEKVDSIEGEGETNKWIGRNG